MIPQKRNHGYLSICLYKNGDRQTLSVHRLVANAFCSKPIGATEINHIDENKQNNRADNLEWCTHIENSNYGTRRKRISKANTNGKRSKRVLQYSLNGRFIKEYPSLAEINRELGFAQGNILRCIQGKYNMAYGYIWKYAD